MKLEQYWKLEHYLSLFTTLSQIRFSSKLSSHSFIFLLFLGKYAGKLNFMMERKDERRVCNIYGCRLSLHLVASLLVRENVPSALMAPLASHCAYTFLATAVLYRTEEQI